MDRENSADRQEPAKGAGRKKGSDRAATTGAASRDRRAGKATGGRKAGRGSGAAKPKRPPASRKKLLAAARQEKSSRPKTGPVPSAGDVAAAESRSRSKRKAPRRAKPLVVHLGGASRRNLRRLQRGRGKLRTELRQVIELVRGRLPDASRNRILVPIVLVYRRKK